jgi:hypothetical protein
MRVQSPPATLVDGCRSRPQASARCRSATRLVVGESSNPGIVTPLGVIHQRAVACAGKRLIGRGALLCSRHEHLRRDASSLGCARNRDPRRSDRARPVNAAGLFASRLLTRPFDGPNQA